MTELIELQSNLAKCITTFATAIQKQDDSLAKSLSTCDGWTRTKDSPSSFYTQAVNKVFMPHLETILAENEHRAVAQITIRRSEEESLGQVLFLLQKEDSKILIDGVTRNQGLASLYIKGKTPAYITKDQLSPCPEGIIFVNKLLTALQTKDETFLAACIQDSEEASEGLLQLLLAIETEGTTVRPGMALIFKPANRITACVEILEIDDEPGEEIWLVMEGQPDDMMVICDYSAYFSLIALLNGL